MQGTTTEEDQNGALPSLHTQRPTGMVIGNTKTAVRQGRLRLSCSQERTKGYGTYASSVRNGTGRVRRHAGKIDAALAPRCPSPQLTQHTHSQTRDNTSWARCGWSEFPSTAARLLPDGTFLNAPSGGSPAASQENTEQHAAIATQVRYALLQDRKKLLPSTHTRCDAKPHAWTAPLQQCRPHHTHGHNTNTRVWRGRASLSLSLFLRSPLFPLGLGTTHANRQAHTHAGRQTDTQYA
mmetsp:Transcript_29024/g.72371  ORF Transcript_29024/g.72371 Transcript_29024/m.72371 type:complete len:238 (+) Transcript_29024:308-1021(+)